MQIHPIQSKLLGVISKINIKKMSDGELHEWDFPDFLQNRIESINNLPEDEDNIVESASDIPVKNENELVIKFNSSIEDSSINFIANSIVLQPGQLLNFSKYVAQLDDTKVFNQWGYDNNLFINYFIYDIIDDHNEYNGKIVGLTTDFTIIKSTFTYDITDSSFTSTLDVKYYYITDNIIMEVQIGKLN